MQVTVERPMLFLGKQRKPGEVINSDDEPALAEVSPQTIGALKDGNYLKPDPGASARSSGMEQHLRAKVDNLEARIKKLEEFLDLGAPAADAAAPPRKGGKKG